MSDNTKSTNKMQPTIAILSFSGSRLIIEPFKAQIGHLYIDLATNTNQLFGLGAIQLILPARLIPVYILLLWGKPGSL